MDERNATLYLAGMGFRIAESPEALVAAGTGVWNTPPHWPADDLEAITDAWPSSIGLAFDTGGAAALESLGDGVYQIADSFASNDVDLALKFQALVMFAFCATDCRRLLLMTDHPSGVQVARNFGLYQYGVRTESTPDGPRSLYHVAGDLDEWAAFAGHPVFFAEARRFGNEDKALRVLQRWTRHTGDATALDFSYLQELDPAYWRVDIAQVRAARAGFQWGHNAAHWIEHAPGCGVPAGAAECSCEPTVGFTNGHATATVQPGGEVSIAAHH